MRYLLLLLFIPFALSAQEFNPNDYEDDVEKIIEAAMSSDVGFDRLEYLCDNFGHRLSGTQTLESAINWIYEEMRKDGLQNVHKEEVYVPNWKRNTESIKLVYPRHAHFEMLGLGGSIATPPEGIKAEVLVVSDKEELEDRSKEAKGKIVLFNAPFTSYGQTVQYRFYGAQWAAKHGAIASLIRSVSPTGMNNPHTGMMAYNDSIKKIPHAAITLEGAEMLQRLQDKGITPVVHLKMNAETLPDALSHNVMGEFKGNTMAEEIIALGGHIDSWDTGHGAHDDGGGCMATWEALRILKELNLQSKRTVRAVMWTNEENGQMGGKEYAKQHAMENHALGFEFDVGTFEPSHIRFTGDEELFEKVQTFEPLLKKVTDKLVVADGGGGVDITPLKETGVPVMSLSTDDQGKYFWYHHSPSDTFDKVDKEDFQKCVAAIAVAIYLYANM